MYRNQTVARTRESALATNKVLRNTYTLLSMTMLFSAAMAAVSVVAESGPGTYLLSVLGAFGLIWLVLPRTANSSAGLGVVFAITGLLGFGLGGVLNQYLAMSNGPQLIMTALGGTGVIFLGLSAYALTTRRDFSFLGGMLFVGMLVILVAALANIFLAIPAMTLAISSIIIVLMSGFILYDTSRIIHGGETNYIMVTVSLYLSIYNIFINLLAILGIMGDD
ncbi:MAG TPA: Bax inhibitor-1/YccA family protein [Gammaproteobacteria bacterium]|nr:Bax inhibitor-1/YccA family protein [Gammaproteobacteria bacterium]